VAAVIRLVRAPGIIDSLQQTWYERCGWPGASRQVAVMWDARRCLVFHAATG